MLKNLSTTNQNIRTPFPQNIFLIALASIFIFLWVLMYLNCIDLQDWVIENLLVFIFAIYTVVTYKKFKFSDWSYLFFFLFLFLHIYGAMYAYTKHPIGAWFQQQYSLWRNPYDRVVHFSFGFLLAYPLHDYLVNKLNVNGKWQYILPCEITLSLACIFELIEWTVAEVTPTEVGETYVAKQGDVWDAHKDIVLALLGAAITMVSLYYYRKVIKKKKASLWGSFFLYFLIFFKN
jgi:putative membrane protein